MNGLYCPFVDLELLMVNNYCRTLHITAETQCPEFKLLQDLKRLMLPNSLTVYDSLPYEIWHLWHLIVCACYCIIL